MDQQEHSMNFEENVASIMQSLPSIVRIYIEQKRYTAVTQELMTKYSLKIDQGGILEREMMLILMGVETPDEFTQSLKEEARLDDETIDGIVQDVNEKIFIPLRQAEEKGGIESGSPAPQAPAVQPVVSKPAPVVPIAAPSQPSLISDVSPRQSFGSTSASVMPSVPSYMVTPRAEMPQPSFTQPAAPALWPPQQPAVSAPLMPPLQPKMAMPQRSAPAPEVAPENLPGAMSAVAPHVYSNPLAAVPEPASIPSPAASPVSMQTPAPEAVVPQNVPYTPIAKSYAVDPYRESVDDSEDAV